MKYTTIYLKLRNPKGKVVEGIIIVRDNFILSTFSDKNLARQLYEFDLEKGEDVSFNEEHNAYIKQYNGKKKLQIVEILKKEIIDAGGEISSIKIR